MIKTTTRQSKLKPEGAVISMSYTDYQIVNNVLALLPKSGLTDEEFSFLLGKNNTYFFTMLNPSTKAKFKVEYLSVLPTILKTTIRKIISNDPSFTEEINLYHASKEEIGNTMIYRHTVYDANGIGTDVIWEKTTITGNRKKINPAVQEMVMALFENGYFATPQRALPLFIYITKHLKTAFTADDIQKSLATLMRKEKVKGIPPLLILKKIDGLWHYVDAVAS